MNGRHVCSSPGKVPSHHVAIHCPFNCKMTKIWEHDFDISQNGTLTITANRSNNTQVILNNETLIDAKLDDLFFGGNLMRLQFQ